MFKPHRIALYRKTEDKLEVLWSRGYVNEHYPPYMAYVANDGQHVVLRDLHGRLGAEKCLVFLGPQGQVLRAYELSEFLTQNEILNALRSVSSTWWSEPGWFVLRDGDRQFAMVTNQGTIRCFDVATGTRLALDDELKARITSEATTDAIRCLADPDADRRTTGATLVGVLGAKQSIPALKELLDEGVGVDDRLAAAAAKSLVQLMGAEAIPILEPVIAKTKGNHQFELLRIMSNMDPYGDDFIYFADTPVTHAVWERLAESKEDQVRGFALAQLIRSDDGTFLREHPDLAQSKLRDVRYAAAYALSKQGTLHDLPLLRKLMDDSDSVSRVWALRGLIRLKPDDIDDVLERASTDKDGSVHFEAMIELARRRKPEAVRWVMQRVQKIKDHTHDRAGWGTGELATNDLCELVVEMNMREAIPFLQEAAKNDCDDIQRAVCGALATFGDAEALIKVRQFAKTGDALDRADAIKWLGICKDAGSLLLLEQAESDEEPWVREAAVKAIGQIRSAKPAATPASLPTR